jgi:cytochrome c5
MGKIKLAMSLCLIGIIVSCYAGKIDELDTGNEESPTDSQQTPLVEDEIAKGEQTKDELCATYRFAYEEDVKPLSAAKCEVCHKSGGSATPYLESTDAWQTNITKVIDRIQGISGARMPLGGKALDPSEIIGIKNWQACDFP